MAVVGFSVISVFLALSLMGAGPEEPPSAESLPMEIPTAELPLETLTYESPVFVGDGEIHRPKQEIERDGKRYRLVSSELQKARKTGRSKFVSSQITLSLEGDYQPPESAKILVNDQDTGQSLEYTVPFMELTEVREEWSDDFSFPVTVSDYGADAFLLGGLEIPGDASLAEYGTELLGYLGLSEENYRIEEMEWSGEPYEKEGKSCRDAIAKGRKLVRSVKARYGGQVELPPVDGLKYQSVYREILEEGEEGADELTASEDKESLTAYDEATSFGQEETENTNSEGSLTEKWNRWLMEHLTVIRLGAGFLAGIVLAALLLFLSGRKGKKKKPGGSA